MYASETMDATNNNYSNNHTKKKGFGEHADSVHQYGNAEQVQIDSQGQYTSKNSKVVDAKKMQVKDKIGLQSVTTHNESILPISSNNMISGQDYDMDNTMKHFTPCRKVTRTSTERKRSLNNTRTFKCAAGNDLELNINISCKREDNSNITKKEEVSHVSTRTDTKTDNNSNSKDLIHVSDKKKSIAGDGTKCVKDIKLLSKDLDRDILTKANSKCCEIQANFSNDNGLKGVKKTKMRFKRMKSSVSDSDKRSINIQPPPNMHTDDKCERDENTKSISMKNNSCDGTNDLTCNDDDSCENTVDTKLKPAEYFNSTTKLSNHLTYHTDDVKSETENTSLEDVKRPLVDLKENKSIESDSDDEKQSNKMQSTVNECLHSTIEDGHIPKQTLGKFTCHLCSKGFSQSCNLKKHMILHTGERPFSCEICEKKFSQAAHLKTHARSHTGEKPYKCDVCGKHFGQSSNLKTHLRTHLCEKPFICLFCDKMFTREEHVKNHMRIHTGEKPYTCTICEKEFTQEAHLKRHLRTHTGERPYTCLTCNKGFTEDGTLKVHMRIHTGERPFICRFCGKGFRDSSNLRRHVGSHTGERAFVCQICDKKYAKKVTLRKHMTTNHSNITEESAVNRLIAQVCETYNEETKALNDARKHSDDETVVNGFLEETDDTDVADTTESEVIEETTQSFTSTDDGHESSDNQETLREDISLTTDVVIKLESVDNEYI